MHITVDLASRFSALAVVDDGGKVVLETDTFQKSSLQFAHELGEIAQNYPDSVVVVEDVPYGISRQAMIKPVLRIQGIIIHEMHKVDALDRLFFLNPSSWQRAFEGVFRGGAAGARTAASNLGYTPPDLLERYADKIPEKGPKRTEARNQLKKIATDYDDAFLMGIWANSHLGGQYTPERFDYLCSISGLQPAFT